MRNGQNKHRMRGRNRGGSGGGGGGGKGHNPLTRVYESNGPDVKIRGTANHVAEKYIQLARDATASGDPVAAENYYQHAEHYFRLIAAAQEQFRQNQPYQQREGNEPRGDDNFDDSDDGQPAYGNTEPHSPREQPQYQQRDQQPYQQRDNNYQPRHERNQDRYQDRNQERNQERNFDRNRNRHQQDNRSQDRQQDRQFDERPPQNNGAEDEGVDRLPSFITGGAPAPAPATAEQPNGHEAQGDRFPLNRRRGRRPRTPRAEMAAEGSDEAASGE